MSEIFGSKELKKGCHGIHVVELQLRLAGFLGTVWDGDFGPNTELQVKAFQTDYINIKPNGIVDDAVYAAINAFHAIHPINFEQLKCPCGNCDGFGNSKYYDIYRQKKPRLERYYKYEYPGIHKAMLHSFAAAQFYSMKFGYGRMFATCGYRCSISNKQKKRTSTNHCGKAMDADLPMQNGDDKRDDMVRCTDVRDLLSQKSNFQIGWKWKNQKSFESNVLSPTWIHADARCYEQQYLIDNFFVKNNDELLNKVFAN